MTYLPRIADAELTRSLGTFPATLVEGARATGKTTSAARHAATVIRLPRDLAMLESDPIAVLSAAAAPVLIDEWQLAGIDLLWAIKELVDADPSPGRFLLTGSVAPETYGPTYPLTGRGTRLTLRPMSQRELAGRGDTDLWIDRLLAGELSTPGRRDGRAELEVLTSSGFPAAGLATEPTDSAGWLRAYAATVAERSVDERRDPVRVARVLRVLAELEAQAVPDETLWTSADVNKATFAAYHEMLTRAFVVQNLPAWQTNRLKRITTYPKRMLAEAPLALALANLTTPALVTDPALAGRYLESFVVSQLRPEVDARGGTLHHVRTAGNDREIDVLIELPDGLIAIEVKAGTLPKAADARHLTWLRDRLGDHAGPQVIASVVLHRGEATFELVEGVWAVPLTTLWAEHR